MPTRKPNDLLSYKPNDLPTRKLNDLPTRKLNDLPSCKPNDLPTDSRIFKINRNHLANRMLARKNFIS